MCFERNGATMYGASQQQRVLGMTLGEVLASQAAQRPHELAVRFIEPRGKTLEGCALHTLSFAELSGRAAAVAQALLECAEPGDRALILCPPGLDYVVALFGCFYSGLVAVPAYPPTTAGVDERLGRLIDDCRPRVLLSIEGLAPICEAACGDGLRSGAGVTTVIVDQLEPVDGGAPIRPQAADSLALLQYTSGSTGDPRGVMLSHNNFLANLSAIAAGLDFSSGAHGVLWLPPYHDMGLIGGILLPVVFGCGTTLMSPLAFLADPLCWLEAVTRYRGTLSAAPNFAFDLCVRRAEPGRVAGLDLTSWKNVVNGAEPVQRATIDRFLSCYAGVGFRRSAMMPSYGLAEATLLVTSARAQTDERETGTVSVGVAAGDYLVLVVDPLRGLVCAEGEVGEIWIQGESVAGGYWENQAESEKLFQAVLSNEPDRGSFLRTGDLGLLRAGELHVTGRVKDVIIVRGRNYYPHDIESAAIGADSRLRPGCLAAFEVLGASGQELILVAEPATELDRAAGEEIWQNVRGRVAAELGLELAALAIVVRGTIPKTSSGKIRRSATCRAYLSGELALVATHRIAPPRQVRLVPAASGTAVGASARTRLGPLALLCDLARALAGFFARRVAQAEKAPAGGLAIELDSDSGRAAKVLGVVCAQVAACHGAIDGDAIDPRCAFKDLGLDSVRVVELTTRLGEVTGLELAATVAFDYPTPLALADHLRAALEGKQPGGPLGERHSRALEGARPFEQEPLAIVGMSCRYPHGVGSPRELWELLAAGGETVAALPEDRGWDLQRLYDPDPEHPGTAYVRGGSFLADATDFDSDFFGLSPREALAMDPQQRLLLESAWEALEDAGISPRSLRGSATGVFAGVISSDYGLGTPPSTVTDGFRLTGSTASVASGRVAYAFGFEGPAISIDTACSSSLVAIHLASQALRAGECSLALAGGVSVMASPALLIEFSRQRGLSVDGRCRSFGADADGVGFSEGVGLLLLERLSDARRAGHRVLALVRGSAVNQDGASNGLTAPNGPSQQSVIVQALANAGLAASEVDVVEGHGTGTTLGDPIEAQGLLATYGRERRQPLWLGSVKSNIGHTQAAAGVAGVIKMVEAMRNELLPRTLHAEEPSAHVDWSQGEVALLHTPVAWPRSERPRRAGVSSFGISGTNAHLILEESPEQDLNDSPEPETPPAHTVLPFVLSAKTSDALREQAKRLHTHLQQNPQHTPLSVAATLALHREHFGKRAAILAADAEQLFSGLRALADGTSAANLVEGAGERPGKVAFLFSGQGSQWERMGLELLDCSPVFSQRMHACERALGQYLDWSLEEVLRGVPGAPSLERLDVVQPALFAVMVSLAELWRSHGVQPDLVIGHSQGEIAAATVAGALSLDDAARVVALRSRALAKLAGTGGMVSVQLSRIELDALLAQLGAGLCLAAVNGPHSMVLSGSIAALEQLMAHCAASDIRARRIAVDYASHSPQIEAIRDELLGALASIRPAKGEIPLYSTLTGERIDSAELGCEYWYRSLRRTVLFEPAVRAAVNAGTSMFIEVSPHPVLAPAVSEIVEESDTVAVVGTLRRDEGGLGRFVTSLAEAHTHGVAVDFNAICGAGTRQVELPSYPFQRRRYWLERSSATGDARSLGQQPMEHPFLAAKLELPDDRGWLYTGRISLQSHAWLGDHVVAGTSLLAGTAFVELALAAAAEVGLPVLEELTLQAPLVLEERGAVHIQVSLSQADERGSRALSIHACAEQGVADSPERGAGWVCHATGAVGQGEHAYAASLADEAWPPTGAEPLPVCDLYERLVDSGLSYGPAFQGLRRAWRRGDELFGEVALDADQRDQTARFLAHPALLDAALHIGLIAERDAAQLPFSFSGIRVGRTQAPNWRVSMRIDDGAISLRASDELGVPALQLDSLRLRPLAGSQLRAAGKDRDSLFALRWPPVDAGSGNELSIAEVQSPEQLCSLESPPDLLLCRADVVQQQDAIAGSARELTNRALALALAFLADERFEQTKLVFLTTRAIAATPGEDLELAQAPLWGLIRSAQAEHPERFRLLDSDGSETSERALADALALHEPQLAIREGLPLAARLESIAAARTLLPPAGESAWRLQIARTGSFDDLALVAAPELLGPLQLGEVRVGVHAAGVNFLDVMASLGAVDRGDLPLGAEGAGVVLETGPGVTEPAVGARVMGIMAGSFGPIARADARLLAPIPDGWSVDQAASAPVAFLTAYYGLVELAALGAGESVLIHAGAGGVGMAAIQLARHLGAEVFATASPQKWATLEALGLDANHIASSRDLAFKDKFLAQTEGRGVDVILNSLAREFVDASLELCRVEGRFIEMGKTDIRDPGDVRATHGALDYRAFDLMEAGPNRIQAMLAKLLALFESGTLEPLPSTIFELAEAPHALRHLSQARHTGKVLLRIPRVLDRNQTVLITGGTGTLGSLLARHLAGAHGIRSLLLVSRSGPAALGAGELAAELEALGASTRIVACDVSCMHELRSVFEEIPSEHPLGAVIHAAGTREDGVLTALDAGQIDRAFAPKLDAAVHLHELTRGLDLSAFILFSSAAATLGSPGQAGYAAANAFLDALACHRRANGLAAHSIAWGLWETASAMTGDLSAADRARLAALTLSSGDGVGLFDQVRAVAEPLVVAAPIDIASLRARARAGTLPPLLGALAQMPARRRREDAGVLAERLAQAPAEQRVALVLELVRLHTATVLGYAAPADVEPTRAFQELGLDSLSALELRNRLANAAGLRLPATMAFDYPNPIAVAEHLLERMSLSGAHPVADERDVELQRAIASIPLWRLRNAGLLDILLELAGARGGAGEALTGALGGDTSVIRDMDVDRLVAMALATGEVARPRDGELVTNGS
jgi:acyl transferase domain-containing protein/acyl-CoA synthetase (AMP-forming)/AMP-acid ligase II/short-subunit dehydrogenase/acyl carrier protein